MIMDEQNNSPFKKIIRKLAAEAQEIKSTADMS